MDPTDGGFIKWVISEMINMEFKSEYTGNSYKKAENMWNDWSYDTGDFPKLNKTEKIDIEGASGTKLLTSLNVFSTSMLSQ